MGPDHSVEPSLEGLRGAPKQAKAAWDAFLDRYSGLILSVIRRYESDHDEIMDRYLFVCEKLCARNFKRLRAFRPAEESGGPSFSTWLTAVVRNLCIDFCRKKEGRRRLFKSLQHLSETDQLIFRYVFWHGHTITETQALLQQKRGAALSGREIAEALQRVRQALREKKLHELIADLAGRYPARIDEPTGGSEERSAPEIAARLDPEVETQRAEMVRALHAALGALSERELLILKLRFDQGLKAKEIAEIVGTDDYRQVYAEIGKILRKLRGELERLGARFEDFLDLEGEHILF
jgi:RNA polymerase sigma factor (sigma-70 family)